MYYRHRLSVFRWCRYHVSVRKLYISIHAFSDKKDTFYVCVWKYKTVYKCIAYFHICIAYFHIMNFILCLDELKDGWWMGGRRTSEEGTQSYSCSIESLWPLGVMVFPIMVDPPQVFEGFLYSWCRTRQCTWQVLLNHTTFLLQIAVLSLKHIVSVIFLPETGWWGLNLQILRFNVWIFKCLEIT